MRKQKVRSNVDKLKLCCTEHGYLFEQLSVNTPNIDFSHIPDKHLKFPFGAVLGYDGICIKVTSVERSTKGEKEAIKIEADIHVDGLPFKYGVITSDVNYLYLTITNRVFYETLTVVAGGERVSLLAILPNIIETLRLKINTVTWCDICVDANVNIRKRILSALKDETLVPIVNHTAYTDKRKKIDGHLRVYEASRVGVCGTPSLYFKNFDETIVVNCYDKAKEISDMGKRGEAKEYIREYNGWKGKMQRLEVRAKSAPIKKFCNDERMTYVEFIENLADEAFRLRLFDWLTYSTIHFNTQEAYAMGRLDKHTLLKIAIGGGSDGFES